jgi:hypothetical protein
VYGDHAITEVWLNGSWVKVDSYTVDSSLFKAAQAKLAQGGRTMGYGVHKDGRNSWDGTSDSFVQYIMPEGTGIFAACKADRKAYSKSNSTAKSEANSKAPGVETATDPGAEEGLGLLDTGAGVSSKSIPTSSNSINSRAAAVGLTGPDRSFSGAAARPDGPMSDRDFGALLGGADLGSVYFPMVAGSSPFAWQRSWWGRQVFRLLAGYCNSRVAAARAGRL